ncbi:cadherin-like domain-containing protein [Desulforhopalus sp. 52FAK]
MATRHHNSDNDLNLHEELEKNLKVQEELSKAKDFGSIETIDTSATPLADISAIASESIYSSSLTIEPNESGLIVLTEEQLLQNASDIDGDQLSVSNLTVDGASLQDNGDGTYTVTPDENYNGQLNFTYDVSDGTETISTSGTLDVTAVNDAVVVEDVDLGVTVEDSSVIFSAEDLLANASDVDGDNLSITEVTVSEEFGTLTDNQDGTYTFNPTENFNGDDVPLQFSVTDGETVDSATATLDVTAVNDGPEVGEQISFTTDEDQAIIITEEQLLQNASDIDGDQLSVSNLTLDGGSLQDNGDGTYTVTPEENYNGQLNFTYDVSDDTETISTSGSINVAAVNDAVVVEDIDLGANAEDSSLVFSAEDLLANASDVDGDNLSITEVTVSEEFGTLTDNQDGTYTFNPTENFNGDDVPLQFSVTDGETVDSATATLDVTAVNDGPEVGEQISFTTDEDQAIIITEEQLLQNASDIDGDQLSISNLTVDGGALQDNGDGTYTVTPDENYNGQLNFTYDVSDGTETVATSGTIDVTAINDAVVVEDVDLGVTVEDSSVIFSAKDLLANASDVDGDNLSITEVTVSEEFGTLTDNQDGTYTFNPTENFNGDDVPLQFSVTDGETVDSATATLDVTAVNDGPEVGEQISFTTDEDQAIIITEEQLLQNASDIDGDQLSISNLTVDGGALQDNGDGTYTVTPDENYNGQLNFTYDVSDGTETVATSGTIDVTAINDAVVVEDVDLGVTVEDSSVIFSAKDLLANASDVDGDNLSITEVTVSEEFGTLTDNQDGTYTFNPTENFSGDDVPLQFSVTDGETVDSATATLDVTAVNDGPEVGEQISFSTDEDQAIIITEEQLLQNASDIDGDQLSVSNLTLDGGSLQDNGDGTYTVTPEENYNGQLNFTYDVSDGTETITTSGSINVAAVNDAVVVEDVDLGATAEDSSLVFSAEELLANASDVDGDNLSITEVTVSEEFGTLTDNQDGTYTFNPTENFHGDDVPLQFSVTDGETVDSATATLDVTAVNDGPEIGEQISFTTDEDQAIIITEEQLLKNASDIDGDQLSVSNLTVDGGALQDNGDGTYTVTPEENYNGQLNFTYDVSDGTETVATSGTIDVTAVNDAVIAEDVDLGTTAEDSSLVFSAEELLAHASDGDGDNLSITEVTVSEEFGTLTDNQDGTYTFNPAENFNGNDVPLQFSVTDGETVDSATATLDVTAVNDGPEVGEQISFTTDEDQAIIITEEQLLQNASDIDGDQLSISNLTVDGGALQDNGDGTYTLTPNENYNGQLNLTYDVSDGTETISTSGSINVAAVNDAVVVEDIDLGATAEDSSLVFSAKDLLANASDVDGDNLSITEVTVSEEFGTLTDNQDGTYTFNPAENFHGDDVPLQFSVTDGETVDSATATLDVTAVNDGPEVGEQISFTTDEDQAIIISEEQLLQNASDIDGDQLSVSNLTVDGGSLQDNGDGTYTVTPEENYNGQLNLTYDVSDGTETVATSGTIDVTAVNDAVIAEDVDLGATAEDSSLVFSAKDLLANASDVDGDNLSITEVTVSEEFGTLTDNQDGTYTFNPAENFHGDDVPLQFSVTDGETVDSATATLDVTAVNDGPEVGEQISFTTDEDQAIIISEEQLLQNASDIDGDQLSVSNLTVDGGALQDNGDGTYTVTPEENYNGQLNFTYDVSDGTETISTSGSINVAAVNDAVIAEDVDLGATAEDSSLVFSAKDLLANASDVDGDNLSITEVTVSEEFGTLTDNQDGTYTFNPAENFHGDDVPLQFSVTDGETVDSATATLDVTAVNDGPEVGEQISFTTDEDQAIIISEEQLLQNASDIDGDQLSVSNLTVDGGALQDNGDGTYTVTPEENYNGQLNFTYDVSDGTETISTSGSINVAAVNDAVVVEDIDLGATAEDSSLVFSAKDLLANASDVDGDNLSITEVTVSEEFGTLTDNQDGTYTFNPTENFSGDDVPLQFSVTDGETVDSATATLDVTAVNDGPEVGEQISLTTDEDQAIIITEEQLLQNASDIDGDQLSVSNLTVDGGALQDNGDGTYTLTPNENYNGQLNFTYDVSDGTETISTSGTLDVTAVNDAVVVEDIDLGATAEDSSLVFSAEDLLANASDVDGDNLSITEVTVSEEFGTLTDNQDGTYTFNPAENFNGNDVPLQFSVTDGETVDSATATLDVTAVNDGPEVGEQISFTTDEDQAIIITEEQLLKNASDIDGDQLSVSNLTVDGGALQDNGDGTYTVTPEENYNGQLNFTYDVSDGTETISTSGTLDVTAVNDAVVVEDIDLGATAEDSSLVFSAEDLLANASDVDGDNLSITEVTVSEEFGTLTDNQDGTYTFNPAENFNGNDVPLQFSVTDGETVDSATATLDVTAVNDGPEVGEQISFTTDEDQAIIITEEQLLKNASDIDGDQLSVSNLTVDGGALQDNGDGTYTVTPEENYNGQLNFTYDVSDGRETVATSGTIDVTAVNDSPVSTKPLFFTMDVEEPEVEILPDPVIRLDTPPDFGVVEVMVEDKWQTMEIGQEYNADSDVRFVPDKNAITDQTRDIQVGTFDGKAQLSDWGEKVDNNTFSYTDGDTTITTHSTDDTLKVYNKSGHVGTGLGDKDNNGLSKGESLVVTVEGEDVNQISFNLDGIGPWFKESSPGANDAWTQVHIKAFDEDGNLIEEQFSSGDHDAANQATYDFITDSPVDHFELTTAGGMGNYVVQGMTVSKSINTDVEFTTISSDGSTEVTHIDLNLQNYNANEPVDLSTDIAEPLPSRTETPPTKSTLTLTEDQLLAVIDDIDSTELTVHSIEITDGSGTITDNNDGTYTVTSGPEYDGELQLSYSVSDGETSVENSVHLSTPTPENSDNSATENLSGTSTPEDSLTEDQPDSSTTNGNSSEQAKINNSADHENRGHGNDEDGVDEDNPAFIKQASKDNSTDDLETEESADNSSSINLSETLSPEDSLAADQANPSTAKDNNSEKTTGKNSTDHEDRGHGNDEDGVDEDNPAFTKQASKKNNIDEFDNSHTTTSSDWTLEVTEDDEFSATAAGEDWTTAVDTDISTEQNDADLDLAPGGDEPESPVDDFDPEDNSVIF